MREEEDDESGSFGQRIKYRVIAACRHCLSRHGSCEPMPFHGIAFADIALASIAFASSAAFASVAFEGTAMAGTALTSICR